MRKLLFCIITFISLSTLQGLFAQSMSSAEVRALITRTDLKSNPAQFESTVAMKDFKTGGKVFDQALHILRKDDKMLAVITAPAIQKGQTFIRNGDDMWMFLPKSKKVMRIGAKDKSMGGEASNTDILRVDLAKDYAGTDAGTETVAGVLCRKLELKANDRSVAYDRVVYWISVDKEIPVKRDYYTLSNKKIKTMYFSELKYFGAFEIPAVVIIENAENPEYKTQMKIVDMNSNVNLADSMFTPEYVTQKPIR